MNSENELIAHARMMYDRGWMAGTSGNLSVRSPEGIRITPSGRDKGDKNALTAAQKRGLALFRGKARCAICHNGILLSDMAYHNLGVPQTGPMRVDVGRYAVTHDPMDKGKFRTPTLRNVALTAPYMHDGAFRTLKDVVDFYDRGGGKSPFTKDSLIMPLHLSAQDKKDLVEFLKSLSGETRTQLSYRASR